MPASLSGWKQKVVAFASALGAPGLFLISFLDSSVLTFPVINDLLLIELSMEHPARMPLYAFMAALGSVMGCSAVFHRTKGRGSFFSPKDRSACTHHPALGGTQWFRGNVDCRASAAANAVQILRVCGRGV